MPDIGKLLLLIGIGIAILGGLILLGNKVGIPFGKLPGDLYFSKDNFSFYFPLVTSIVLSIIVTVAINLFILFYKK